MTVKQIIASVAAEHGVPVFAITSRDAHQREVVAARYRAMAIARRDLQLSTTQIGRMFGGFHHTTVIYGLRVAGEVGPLVKRKKRADLESDLDELRWRIGLLERKQSGLVPEVQTAPVALIPTPEDFIMPEEMDCMDWSFLDAV